MGTLLVVAGSCKKVNEQTTGVKESRELYTCFRLSAQIRSFRFSACLIAQLLKTASLVHYRR